MSRRTRSAKGSWYTDVKICALSRDVRATFKGIIEVMADDWGRFVADSRLVKGDVWPFDDDITARKLENYLRILEQSGRVALYEVEGIRYGLVVNWFKHQRIDHPTLSEIPEPPEPYARIAREFFESLSRLDRERLRKKGLGSGSGSGMLEKEKERERERDEERDRTDRETEPPAAALSEDRAEELPAPPPALPEPALMLLSRMPTDKRLDGEAQLRATLTPAGAKIRKGEYAHAQNVRHLAHACRHVLRKMPDDPRVAVVWALTKLTEPWADTDVNGRTATEAAAANGKLDRAAEERDRRQKLADAEEWATAHSDEWAEIEARIAAGFPGHERDAFKASALRMALVSAKIEAAGAPTLATGGKP